MTAGLGVDNKDAFAKVLEWRLNNRQAGAEKRSEVIVLAQNSNSTSQQLYLLEYLRLVPGLGPDR